MDAVAIKIDASEKYKVQENDTLASIVKAKCADWGTWQALARYNWGTDLPIEVNRLLLESIGLKAAPNDDASQTVLKPAAGLTAELLIPKTWTDKDFKIKAQHVITVRDRIPPVAVVITKLDKWFIPDAEACDVGYRLEGLKTCADKVRMQVFGSKYADCTAWNDGFGTWTDMADTPIYEETLDTQAEQRTAYDLPQPWKGKASTAAGMLGRKYGGKDRFLNVAFSPYTAHFRYFKSDGDKDARIDLLPFWPRFDNTTPKPETLKIQWKIKNTGRLKFGHLEVSDKTGAVVFRMPITPDKLAAGEWDYSWDGKMESGTTIVPTGMPYRVQIQAHTGVDEANGLALAAMHTEVRLYAHPETKDFKDTNYKPADAKSSLTLALGRVVPDDPLPAPGVNAKWFQLKLAEFGFHPGPVTGDGGQNEYKWAMKELQRSIAKTGTNNRLTINEAGDADTQAALQAMPPEDIRPWFAQANRTDLAKYDPVDTTNAALNTALRDQTGKMIVWVDDRHAYTEGSGLPEPAAMQDYRHGMSVRDQKTTYDAETCLRPWIPLRAEPRLLSRAHTLDSEVAAPTDPAVIAATRAALGPLRVDWSFFDIDPDTSLIPTGYTKAKNRTKRFVDYALDNYKTIYTRRDTTRKVANWNCPATLGGVRPASDADYFKSVWGLADKALPPWKTIESGGTETIVTVVHDYLVASQNPFFQTTLGYAGIYFNPSNIAGDGYRVRADVKFEKQGAYDFPNLDALKARYDRLPQTHSSEMRIWRKSSFRGYTAWQAANSGNWPGFLGGFNTHYNAAHVHFVHEKGAPLSSPLTDYFNGALADNNSFKDIIFNACGWSDKAKMTFSTNYVWPWGDQNDLGWTNASPPNLTFAELRNKWFDMSNGIHDKTWRAFRKPLLMELLARFEQRKGRLRGHLFVEFKASAEVWVQEYECDGTCGGRYWYVTKSLTVGAGRADGLPCKLPCNGHHHPRNQKVRQQYKCDDCNQITTNNDDNYNGNARVGSPCTNTVPFLRFFTRTCPGHLAREGALQKYNADVPRKRWDGWPLAAVGVPLGATWLFDADAETWAHEVGHHRQFEHAASAPGAQWEQTPPKVGAPVAQHDNDVNTLQWALPHAHTGDERWDRDCIMSYTTGETLTFCGKCVLRNRGWKVAAIGSPGPAINDDSPPIPPPNLA